MCIFASLESWFRKVVWNDLECSPGRTTWFSTKNRPNVLKTRWACISCLTGIACYHIYLKACIILAWAWIRQLLCLTCRHLVSVISTINWGELSRWRKKSTSCSKPVNTHQTHWTRQMLLSPCRSRMQRRSLWPSLRVWLRTWPWSEHGKNV